MPEDGGLQRVLSPLHMSFALNFGCPTHPGGGVICPCKTIKTNYSLFSKSRQLVTNDGLLTVFLCGAAAAQYGDVDRLIYLVDEGGKSVSLIDAGGYTALHLAAQVGHYLPL